MRGLGCVTNVRVWVRFTKPIPRIFLHVCRPLPLSLSVGLLYSSQFKGKGVSFDVFQGLQEGNLFIFLGWENLVPEESGGIHATSGSARVF